MYNVNAMTKQAKLLVVFFTFLAFVALFPPSAYAQTAWSGVCISDGETLGSGDVPTIQGFQCLIGNVLMVAVRLIGLVGFIMMIYGAFTYMLSGGSSKAADNAKNTLTFAVVGLVVALSAIIILNLLAAFTGINIITEFRIPQADSVPRE